MDFGETLKKFREIRKIPIESRDAGKATVLGAIRKIDDYDSFSRQAYYDYENNRTEPPVKVLHALARLYDIVPSRFLWSADYCEVYVRKLIDGFRDKKDFAYYETGLLGSIFPPEERASYVNWQKGGKNFYRIDFESVSNIINRNIADKLKNRLKPVLDERRSFSRPVSRYSEELLLDKILKVLDIGRSAFDKALKEICWLQEPGGDRIIIGKAGEKLGVGEYDNPYGFFSSGGIKSEESCTVDGSACPEDDAYLDDKIDDDDLYMKEVSPPLSVRKAKLVWFLYKNGLSLKNWPDDSFDQAVCCQKWDYFTDKDNMIIDELTCKNTEPAGKRIAGAEAWLFEIMGYDYNRIKAFLRRRLYRLSRLIPDDYIESDEENLSRLIFRILYYVAEEFPSRRYDQRSFDYLYGNKDCLGKEEAVRRLNERRAEAYFVTGDYEADVAEELDICVEDIAKCWKLKKPPSKEQKAACRSEKAADAFPIILKTARKLRWPELSGKEFAAECGINYQTYNKYETGTNWPNNQKLLILAGKLGLSVDELIGFFTHEQLAVILEPLLLPGESISKVNERSITISAGASCFELPVSVFAEQYIAVRYEAYASIMAALKEELFGKRKAFPGISDFELTVSPDIAELIAGCTGEKDQGGKSGE